jgi:hypothetical protein
MPDVTNFWPAFRLDNLLLSGRFSLFTGGDETGDGREE